MIWLLFATAVAIAVTALVAYAAGKWWLGWTAFRGHFGTIAWSIGFKIDRWHWRGNPIGLVLAILLLASEGASWWTVPIALLLLATSNAWLDAEPSAHFDSTGYEFGIGPFFFRAMGKDTN